MARTQLHSALRQFRGLLEAEHLARLSDARLLECFVRNRDERAFALLVERHGRLVWSACRQFLRHEQDVEDAYQAAFLVLVRRAASIRRGQTVACWLYRVASRIARKLDMDRIKRLRRETKALRALESPPDQDLTWRELQRLLEEELGRLPEKYQAPFVLCCLEGKSKSEAARQLGWKEGTVSSRLAQARKRLQQSLSRRGIALASVLSAADLLLHDKAAPAGLAHATIKAASWVLAGGATQNLLSPGVVALIEGAIKTMFVSKIKTTITVALTVCLAATGTVAMAWQRHSGVVPLNVELAGVFTTRDFDEPENRTPDQSAARAAKPTKNPWVGIASRETNAGPEVAVQFEDGHRRTYSASADSVLLSYMGDNCLGGHEVLSIDMDDTNRMLLRFDLPRGGRVKKAELLLARSQTPHPIPPKPITLSFHELKESWQENKATWNRQPAFEPRSTLTAQIDPANREYRIDVTALVRRVVEDGATNHGWLVRIDTPLATHDPKAGGAPAGWSCHGTEYVFALDDAVRLGGKHSCRIEGRAQDASSFAMMSQTIRADDYRGQRIRLSAHFKTEGLQGMATLWMRIDGDQGLLGIDKSIDEAVRGTLDWRPAHIVLDVPEESKTIRFAVLVEGAGKAWVDNLKLEAVDRSVPLTNALVRPAVTHERKPTLPRQPVNMDFE